MDSDWLYPNHAGASLKKTGISSRRLVYLSSTRRLIIPFLPVSICEKQEVLFSRIRFKDPSIPPAVTCLVPGRLKLLGDAVRDSSWSSNLKEGKAGSDVPLP